MLGISKTPSDLGWMEPRAAEEGGGGREGPKQLPSQLPAWSLGKHEKKTTPAE